MNIIEEEIHSTYPSNQEVLDVEISTYANGQKVLDIQKIKYSLLREEMYLTCINSQKVSDTEIKK